MNEARGNRFFMWSLVIFFGGLLALAITLHQSREADLAGERNAYTDCTVADKYDKKIARGQSHKRNYFIESSCGTFRATSKELSDEFEIGYSYDWSATQGNWANKPTILSIDNSY